MTCTKHPHNKTNDQGQCYGCLLERQRQLAGERPPGQGMMDFGRRTKQKGWETTRVVWGSFFLIGFIFLVYACGSSALR